MASIKNQIKGFFNFNKKQERGTFILLALIFIVLIFRLMLPLVLTSEPYDYTSDLAEIEKWKASKIEEVVKAKTKPVKFTKKKTEPVILSPKDFNPNMIDEKECLAMGLPPKVVNTLLRYRAKGGQFYKAEDLKKIYGLTPAIYSQLKDYIEIPIQQEEEDFEAPLEDKKNDLAKTIVPLEINRADSISLLQIPGIGPFYAGQIVKYRNLLGGYISLDQLGEIYKMDSIRLNAFLPYLIYKDTTINKIDINTVEFKDLLRHPYFDYETTKNVFQERNKLGKFAGLYQLLNSGVLSDSLYAKVYPYLKAD